MYSDISDRNFDQVIHRIKLQHLDDGEQLMISHLARRVIQVLRSSLCASINCVDPINTVLQRSVAVRRKGFHTSRLNSVWQIDSNHKMIH